LLKQITATGVIGVVVVVIIALFFSNYSIEENVEKADLIIKGDVIMPTKVSRPGCEETDRCYIPSLIVIEKGKQVDRKSVV
jgi:hypothetical protein